MKRIILAISLLFFNAAFGQLRELTPTRTVQVGKVDDMIGSVYLKLVYVTSDTNKTRLYSIMYKNQKYQALSDYRHIDFSSLDGEVEELYKIFKNAFSSENKANKEFRREFELGETKIALTHYNGMKNWIEVWTPDGYFYMKERHVDLLFGKLVKDEG